MSGAKLGETLLDLRGRAAIITGSSHGIGCAIAMRLAQHGADVVISGRKIEACEATAAQINARDSGRAIAVPANLTDVASLNELVAQAENAFGNVDILVAKAAIHIHVGPSAGMSDAVLAKTMDANFIALHRLSQLVLSGMIERRFGRIINIGTVAAHFGSGQYHSYTLSKAAAMQ
jgi:NAD(P)-dependent dehydrogenase (short-subunit alcohol dehydrogenase family)